MEFDVEAPCSASCKRGAVSGKSSISCHPSELQEGPELSSRRYSLGYRKDLRLALYFRYED